MCMQDERVFTRCSSGSKIEALLDVWEERCVCPLLCFDMAAELGRCCAMALLPLSVLTALLLAMRLMDETYIVEHLEVIFRTDASPSSRSFNSNYMLLGSQGNNSGIHSLCGSLVDNVHSYVFIAPNSLRTWQFWGGTVSMESVGVCRKPVSSPAD